MKMLIPGGEPFFYLGGEPGCLLIHGFPGAPEEMRWLGQYLAAQGITSLGVRLFGHGTRPSDLLRARKEDWQADVEGGLACLQGCTEKQVAIGLSMGGMLAMDLAANVPLTGLVVMSTPWVLPPPADLLQPFLPVLERVWRYRTPNEPSDWIDKQAEALNVNYPVQPLHAVGQLLELLRLVKTELGQIKCPAHLIYSEGDPVAPPPHGQSYLEQLGSDQKELTRISGSGHNIVRDAAREIVFQTIVQFVHSLVGDPA
jgi:carboxylesterase